MIQIKTVGNNWSSWARFDYLPPWDGLVIRLSASHIGYGFVSWPCPVHNVIKMVQTVSLLGTSALGCEFASAAHLCKRSDSVWICLWGLAVFSSLLAMWIGSKSRKATELYGDMQFKYPRINRERRVLFHGHGFLSSTAWSLMPKKLPSGFNVIFEILFTSIFMQSWTVTFHIKCFYMIIFQSVKYIL